MRGERYGARTYRLAMGLYVNSVRLSIARGAHWSQLGEDRCDGPERTLVVSYGIPDARQEGSAGPHADADRHGVRRAGYGQVFELVDAGTEGKS